MYNFSRINPLALDLMEPSVKQNVTTSSVLLKSSTQLYSRRTAELEQQLSQRSQQNPKASIKGQELTSFKLRWREGKKAPCVMERSCDAVVDGYTVYIKRGDSVEIYSYDATKDSWSKLPDCIYGYCSIAIVDGWLTVVGGGKDMPTIFFNELFSLTREGSFRWRIIW